MFKRKKKRKPGGVDKAVAVNQAVMEASEGEESADGSDKEVDDGKEWAKKVDEHLRLFISTPNCMTAVTDNHFNNPPLSNPPTPGRCNHCANCLAVLVSVPQEVRMEEHSQRPSTPVLDHTPSSSVHSTPSKSPNRNGKRPIVSTQATTRSGPSTRRDEHLREVRAALERWRFKKHCECYGPNSYTSAVLLPDPIITKISSNARIRTVDDLKSLSPPWIFAERHGQELLDLLDKLDRHYHEQKEKKKLEKREAKKKETAARHVQKRTVPAHDGEGLHNVHARPTLQRSTVVNTTVGNVSICFPILYSSLIYFFSYRPLALLISVAANTSLLQHLKTRRQCHVL
jgi:hypothetical protein